MTKLPCEIIMDLIPLVLDHVASTESEALVKEHIATCPKCQAYFNDQKTPELNDAHILSTIRKTRRYTLSFFLIMGIITGVLLSSGYYLVFNLIIMVILGILCHLIKPQKTYLLALLCSFGFTLLSLTGSLLHGRHEGLFTSSCSSFLVIFLLIMIGKLIAMLIHYAWKGEWK